MEPYIKNLPFNFFCLTTYLRDLPIVLHAVVVCLHCCIVFHFINILQNTNLLFLKVFGKDEEKLEISYIIGRSISWQTL